MSEQEIRQEDLIFDVGMHRGEDTKFYLAKGFRVVAIEAHPDLCIDAANRFDSAVRDGQLEIVNAAITDHVGTATFYENPNSIWGTIHTEWRDRNANHGFPAIGERNVAATTLAAVIKDHGLPYYVKIDIEGADMAALASLEGTNGRPRYVSIESSKVSFRDLASEIRLFEHLGYRWFKVVPQRWVHKQRLPVPALEGAYVNYRFEPGSSGAFGEEAPGKWLSASEALKAYRRVFLEYALRGDDPFVQSRLARGMLGILGFRYNWHDTHAMSDRP